MMKSLCLFLSFILLGQANATVYTFTQSGFNYLGIATGDFNGSFTGEDLDGDGQLVQSASIKELTAFTATIEGRWLFPTTTFGLTDVVEFVWSINTPYIGDTTGALINGMRLEKVLAEYNGAVAIYQSGLDPLFINTGNFSYEVRPGVVVEVQSSESVVITGAQENPTNNVPLPTSLLLMAAGAALLQCRTSAIVE